LVRSQGLVVKAEDPHLSGGGFDWMMEAKLAVTLDKEKKEIK
jgi:hypothetical protein